jgi:hypothetical protein
LRQALQNGPAELFSLPRPVRELIRLLARRLAQDDPEAAQLRARITRSLAGEPPRKGGILAARRRSPLVAPDLEFRRDVTQAATSICDAVSARTNIVSQATKPAPSEALDPHRLN